MSLSFFVVVVVSEGPRIAQTAFLPLGSLLSFPSFPPSSHHTLSIFAHMAKWGSDDDEIPRRDKEMSDDRAEVKKVESIGKKACWGGLGVSVLGGVISAIGIGKDTGELRVLFDSFRR